MGRPELMKAISEVNSTLTYAQIEAGMVDLEKEWKLMRNVPKFANMEIIEREALVHEMNQSRNHSGHKVSMKKVAESLGIGRATIFNWITKYQVNNDDLNDCYMSDILSKKFLDKTEIAVTVNA